MKKVILSMSAAVMLMLGLISVNSPSPVSAGSDDYGETVAALPDGLDYITDLKAMPDGTLAVMCASTADGDIIKLTSADGGITWNEEARYMDKLPVDVSGAAKVEASGYLSDDGYTGIYIDLFESCCDDVDKCEISSYRFIIKPDGDIVELKSKPYDEAALYKMQFAGDDLYVHDIRGNVYKYNRNNGQPRGLLRSM